MTEPQEPSLYQLDHLVLTVADIMVTRRFYEDALGMKSESFVPADGTTRWALKFGQQKINLHQAGQEFEPKSAWPTPGSADLCFLTDVNLDTWRSHFHSLGIDIEEGPIARTGATGPILSIYVRDPDENLIEISTPV